MPTAASPAASRGRFLRRRIASAADLRTSAPASAPAAARRRTKLHAPSSRSRAAPPPPTPPPKFFHPFSAPELLDAGSSSLPHNWEEMKVVVSVTVEGSVQPVRTLLRLGATVEDAITAAVERYRYEGRCPKLDLAAPSAFQLHYSHFSLESLNKNEKIGEVGSRTFYLCKNGASAISSEGLSAGAEDDEGRFQIIHRNGNGNGNGSVLVVQDLTQLLFIVAMKKLSKIGRRARRLWRIITCIGCR